MKYFYTFLFVLAFVGNAHAQYAKAPYKQGVHAQVVSGLLQMNEQNNVAMKTTAVPTQRVIAQSTFDNATSSLSDSIRVAYTGMRNSKYDYNTMIYPYNYPYNTTPMFDYAGVFTKPQVQYDTYVHWTINPFTMPTFILYEGCTAIYDVNNNLVKYRHVFTDSVTNDNVSYANTFTTTNNINSAFWFNLNAGVEDSAFKQFFVYNTSGKLVVDSVYTMHLGVWRIAAKTNYTYDGSGNLTQIDHFANETDTSFLLPLIQQSKYVNTYDASNRLQTVYTHLFNGTVLAPYVKDTFGYSGSLLYHNSWRQHQLDAIHITWWPQYNMSKHINTAGKPDTVFHKGWDSILNSWIPTSMDVVSYNTNNNPDTLKSYLYNWTSYSSTPDFVTKYYYEIYLDATQTPGTVKTVNSLKLYPNPATNTLNVSLPENSTQPFVLTITNISGQMVSRQWVSAQKDVSIQVDGLPAGTYWVAMQAKGGNGPMYSGQFVKN